MAEEDSNASSSSRKRTLQGMAPTGGFHKYSKVSPSPKIVQYRIAHPQTAINEGHKTFVIQIKAANEEMNRLVFKILNNKNKIFFRLKFFFAGLLMGGLKCYTP